MMFAKLVDTKKNDDRSFSKKQPSNPVPKKQANQPAATSQAPTPTTYHSDRNDQRLANTNGTTRKPSEKSRYSRQDDVGAQPRQSNARSKAPAKRPRTSAQNEASLIEMLNNQ